MRGFEQTFERWTDALNMANSLKPKLKSWFQDIRIFEDREVVWVFSKSHTYPQYIGPGAYNRLAERFVAEAEAEAALKRQGLGWPIGTGQGESDGQSRLVWGQRTYLMGVLNVTPDSFSDGGQFTTLEQALQQANHLVRSGVDIVDIGGQSTRPGAEPIDLAEELRRVVPIIEAIRRSEAGAEQRILISVDTTRAVVAEAAIGAGADLVNDISAGTFDPEMFTTVARLQVPIILMHLRGTPATMQQLTDYGDVVAEVCGWLQQRAEAAISSGIPSTAIALDPGIGFAKTADQNLEILRRLPELKALGYPVLVGPSRKSFIGKILDQPDPQQRVWGTAAACCAAIAGGADILRIHDAAAMHDVRRVADAIWRKADALDVSVDGAVDGTGDA